MSGCEKGIYCIPNNPLLPVNNNLPLHIFGQNCNIKFIMISV